MAGVPRVSSRNVVGTPKIRVQKVDSEDVQGGDVALYHGVSKRPLGWKMRSSTRTSTRGSMARPPQVRRFDGHTGTHTEWDGLRRDPELWFPHGNCLIHLHEAGSSRRGPTFRVPMEALIANECRPLLDRVHIQQVLGDTVNSIDGLLEATKTYELFIPAPPNAEREEAFLHHIATRNLLAWIFGRPLVGTHLGAALVGLLNSMTEFRSASDDNVPAIIDYMIDEGYGQMSNNPSHALGVLFFAEHFHFKDLWIDAHAHCVGMSERLYESPGFENLSAAATDLISSSRFELHIRLDSCGRMLSSFLSDELSDAYIGLSIAAREHLDKFRSFLQMYFVARLGYYPPQADDEISSTFPKYIYAGMQSEFRDLYNFLADRRFTAKNTALLGPKAAQGGICVFQNLRSFDGRHGFKPLHHALPLLPEELNIPDLRKKRMWGTKKADGKMGLRLAIIAELSRATNYSEQSLLDCTLVRAYRSFEKQCVMEAGLDKADTLSQTDARKVRWILVYTILQVLGRATHIPEQVRGTEVVPYNLGKLVGDLPWKEDDTTFHDLTRTQSSHNKHKYKGSIGLVRQDEDIPPVPEIKPDIDYLAMAQQKPEKTTSAGTNTPAHPVNHKSTVRKALGALSNVPDLMQPSSRRRSQCYESVALTSGRSSNGSVVTLSAPEPSADDLEVAQTNEAAAAPPPPIRFIRTSSFDSDLSSKSQTHTNDAARSSQDDRSEGPVESPTTSISSVSRSGSNHSANCPEVLSEENQSLEQEEYLSNKARLTQEEDQELEDKLTLEVDTRIKKLVPPPPPSPRGLMDVNDYMTAMKEVEAAFRKGVADFASQHDIVVGQEAPTAPETAGDALTAGKSSFTEVAA